MTKPEQTCFMIQCFDGGKYDKRYAEVYKEAIEHAGLRPVRADMVLGTTPIIQVIEQEILKSDAVLADISESNDNVFLELGYALALNKPSVIICDREKRSGLPFDIRHRPVIFYDSHSPSSFGRLKDSICATLRAEIAKEKKIIVSNRQTNDDGNTVEDYENAIISIVLASYAMSPEGIALYSVSRDFERLSYTESTFAVGVESLISKGYIKKTKLYDQRDNEEYPGLSITESGMQYVMDNRLMFTAKIEKPTKNESEPPF